MIINLIACIASNNAIGKDGHCIYNIRADRQRLHQVIEHQAVIIGRKTYHTIPPRILQNAITIVVSSTLPYLKDAQVYRTFTAALTAARAQVNSGAAFDIYILGGAEIYEQALPYATQLLLTIVDDTPEADTFFPQIDPADWDTICASDIYPLQHDNKQLTYQFLTLKRKRSCTHSCKHSRRWW